MTRYKVRRVKEEGYTWMERRVTRWFFGRHPTEVSDVYEVIPLSDALYRRHVLHNGQRLPKEEEKDEQQRLDQAMREALDQRARVRPTQNASSKAQTDGASGTTFPVDPQSTEIRSTTAEARKRIDAEVARVGSDAPFYIGAEWFKRRLPDLRLPFEELPDGFDLSMKDTQVLDGRSAYVVEAIPKPLEKGSTNDQDDRRNFEIALWIDQSDAELIKVEGRALGQGILSAKPDYAVTDTQNYSKEAAAKAKRSVYGGSLQYSKGTVVGNQWAKIDGEIWLPSKEYIKGKEIWTFSGTTSAGENREVPAAWAMEHERTCSDYKKFRVDTRALPAAPQ